MFENFRRRRAVKFKCRDFFSIYLRRQMLSILYKSIVPFEMNLTYLTLCFLMSYEVCINSILLLVEFQMGDCLKLNAILILFPVVASG